MKRLLNYFVNGRGMALGIVFGVALLFWGVFGVLFNHMVQSFVEAPATVAFLDKLPTVEIKDGRIVAPLITEEEHTFPIGEDNALTLVLNTTLTDKPEIPFDQGAYVTANALYLKNAGGEQAFPFDPTLNETITPEAFRQTLMKLSGLFGFVAGFFPFLSIIAGFIIVYLIVLGFGFLFNDTLTFTAWGRIAGVAWTLTAVGFTSVLFFAGQLNAMYVIAFAVILSFIFALKCRVVKSLSVKQNRG